MLKTPLLLCVREPTKIVLDPQEYYLYQKHYLNKIRIQKQLIKSNKSSRASMISIPKPTERRSRFNTEPNLSEIINKSYFMNEMMRRSVTDLSDRKNHVRKMTVVIENLYLMIAIPKFRKREFRSDANVSGLKDDFEESPREDPDGIHFEMVIASPE